MGTMHKLQNFGLILVHYLLVNQATETTTTTTKIGELWQLARVPSKLQQFGWSYKNILSTRKEEFYQGTPQICEVRNQTKLIL